MRAEERDDSTLDSNPVKSDILWSQGSVGFGPVCGPYDVRIYSSPNGPFSPKARSWYLSQGVSFNQTASS